MLLLSIQTKLSLQYKIINLANIKQLSQYRYWLSFSDIGLVFWYWPSLWFYDIVLLNGYFHIKPVLCPRQSYWVEVSCIDPRQRVYAADRGQIRLYEDIIQVLYENTHFMTPLLTNDLKLQYVSYFFVVVITIELIKTSYNCMMT